MRMKKMFAAVALTLILGSLIATRVQAGSGMNLPQNFFAETDSYIGGGSVPMIAEYTILEYFSDYRGERIPWTYYEDDGYDVYVYQGYLDFIGRETSIVGLPPKYGFGAYIYKGDKRDFRLADVIKRDLSIMKHSDQK